VKANRAGLAGIGFVVVRFTPKSSLLANEECGPVNIIVTDRGSFRPVSSGVEIAYQLNLLHSGTWKVEDYLRLLVNRAVLAVLRKERHLPRLPRPGRMGWRSSLASGRSTLL